MKGYIQIEINGNKVKFMGRWHEVVKMGDCCYFLLTDKIATRAIYFLMASPKMDFTHNLN